MVEPSDTPRHHHRMSTKSQRTTRGDVFATARMKLAAVAVVLAPPIALVAGLA
jgi:hypothetical protein